MAYLYGASVQGIQEYIFATNELKSIVGASEIIKNINREIDTHYKSHIIVNAAGNIKLVFEEDAKGNLQTLVRDFLKKVRQNAYGITISQAVVHFENGQLKEAFSTLEKRLFIQRNKNDLPPDMSINLLKLAQKSGKPMVEKDKDVATLQKEKSNTSKGNIPKNRKNKTAIIHADGNGLGAMIASMTKRCKSDTEVIEAYKNFSQNLDKATREAYETAKSALTDKEIREVILGGDDMTIICEADSALSFTGRFLSAFEEKSKAYLGESLTACAGIAYCNHKYPFHYAVNLAEALCSHAKSHSREASSVMFHNIQSASFNSYDEYIDKELTLVNDQETVHLNYGPYFIHPRKPYAAVDALEHITAALMLKGSPASRLREWLTILGENSAEAAERLKRIDEMMELKQDLYDKRAYENNLREFDEALTPDHLLVCRGDETYTPVADWMMHLSVVTRSES